MMFHALLLVRDEGDIIKQSLHHLLGWADAVYIFDSGSSDQTWNLIQGIAKHDHRVRLIGHDAVYFSEKRLRGYLFDRAREHMSEGDWFVRVDGDEFYHMSPREFVCTKMQRHETVAYHQYFNFHLTIDEALAWEHGRETKADRDRPITERRRWFTISEYSEPRLCRYRQLMRWPETASFPYNAGYIATDRLPIRHYPHRDPVQLKRRCILRAAMMANPESLCNGHWGMVNWRRHLVDEKDSHLRYWSPGTSLPQPGLRNHLGSTPKRLVQRLVHSSLLGVLDRLRVGYSENAYPVPIPAVVQEALARDLGNSR